jgi:hypothetical protein
MTQSLSVVRGPARLSGRAPGSWGVPSARWLQPGARLGQPSTPQQRDAQSEEIEAIVREIAVELKLRTDRLVGELEVSQDPELRIGIPLLGQEFSSAELAGQVVLVAQALQALADSILSGPLSSYASEEVTLSLSDSRSLLAALEAQAQPLAVRVLDGHEGLAEEHLLSYVEDLKELRDSAERLMVATEQAPPVMEPAEKALQDASGLLTAIGALAVGGLVIYLFVNE